MFHKTNLVAARVPNIINIIYLLVAIRVVEYKGEQDRQNLAPKTVDFNVNGACNLDCPFCWGPVHDAEETVSIEGWMGIATRLHELGTRKVVITGGETLMKEGLAELTYHLHENLGMKTTISTNGILFRQRGIPIMPYIDDIGLPIDGHNVEINNLMRKGTPAHFSRVLDAIRVVQSDFPSTDVTVRTVVSSLNANSVPLIGDTLLEHGIDPNRMRWKIYQCTAVGPRADVVRSDLEISESQYRQVIDQTIEQNPEFINIHPQFAKDSVGRYFHINPDGATKVVIADDNGVPIEVETGNIAYDFEGVIGRINSEEINLNGANLR